VRLVESEEYAAEVEKCVLLKNEADLVHQQWMQLMNKHHHVFQLVFSNSIPQEGLLGFVLLYSKAIRQLILVFFHSLNANFRDLMSDKVKLTFDGLDIISNEANETQEKLSIAQAELSIVEDLLDFKQKELASKRAEFEQVYLDSVVLTDFSKVMALSRMIWPVNLWRCSSM